MYERRVVAGLAMADWGPVTGSPVVLALHGLTSTSEVWSAMAGALPAMRVVAPDLPGRGGSTDVPTGPGLPGHAQAVLRLADELQLHDVIVVGHSMGAFLAPLVAAKLGDRARSVIMLDGGVAPARAFLLRRPIVRLVFGAATRRLGRKWSSVEKYARATEGKAVANRPDLHQTMLAWSAYMLAGPPGALRPRISRDRLVDDAADSLSGPATLGALARTTQPAHLIAATRGADDNAAPFLTDAALEAGRAQLPRLTIERADANHLTLLFDPSVPAAVARAS
ncbi:alpha/beta fold hydrolase [Actinoplanes sp. NPDC049265]|uniref:alpha/beta fold hydrolase n=1 Tax=Actinoplanes sp. NPDC049265 TaxID=3363902 RepID=UPI003711B35C